jgi:hypothetical protein
MAIETQNADPVVVALWKQDNGTAESETSLPPLMYYCPKCMRAMTKHRIEEWADDSSKIIPGYHIYSRGLGENWHCGPLKMYDPKTDENKCLLAHYGVYKGIPIQNQQHLEEIKAKEERGESIP